MSGWSLGLDFGTSFTVAAIANGEGPRLVDVEGDGSSRLASAVWLDDSGHLVVGSSALHQAVFAPDRLEATPKRIVGEGDVLLGETAVSDVDLVAAVLDRVGSEARRVAGGSHPARVVLTHPAEWGRARQGTLRDAAERANLPHVELVEEPVAAALRIGVGQLAVGQHLVVYDFGGGTFDVAVLRRTPQGAEVAGPPGGRDPLGGEDIDQRIIDFLGTQPIASHPDWTNLIEPPDVKWRRAASGFRTEVRRAKEGLSGQLVWQLWVPGLEQEVQLTRADLEGLIEADIEATLDIVLETVAAAGIEPTDLKATYLIGGSSRIPMVADRVWRRLGQPPSIQDDPKTVVALGAAALMARPSNDAPTPTPIPSAGPDPQPHVTPPAPAVPGGSEGFVSRVAIATKLRYWTAGVFSYGYLTLIDEDGATVAVSDEPDPGGLDKLIERRAADPDNHSEFTSVPIELLGSQGLEVRGGGLGDSTLRCALIQGRAVAATFDAASEPMLGRLERRFGSLDPARFYQLPIAVRTGAPIEVRERLELIRQKSGHRVTAESVPLPPGTMLPDWSARRVATFSALPGYQWLSQSSSRLLPSPRAVHRLGVLDGEVGVMHTFRVSGEAVPSTTRVWVGMVDGRGYSVAATLPDSDKLIFRFLLGHMTLAAAGDTRY